MALPLLRRRPSAERMTVQQLIERVIDGNVRVPPFQRGLRWGPRDCELLIDSIVRGYPVGTLLLWRRPAEAGVLRLGPIELEVPAQSQAYWVVDGQQRITALVNVLVHDGSSPRSPLALDYDLTADRVVRAAAAHTPGSVRMPLHRVVDAADLGEWAMATGLDRDTARRAFEIGRTTREYELAAYVVDAEDERALRVIFQRTNATGKRLQAHEIFSGLHGGGAGDSPSTLSALGSELMILGFGRISDRWLHQAALAVAGIDSTATLPRQYREPGTLELAIRDSLAPLRRSIEFLRDVAGIPHVGLLPYGLVLPVLARFFSVHPAPKERTEELLRRWVWRGAISEVHRGDVVPERRQNFSAIREKDEEGSVQRLLELVPRSEPAAFELALPRFTTTHADAKVWLAALAALDPRRLDTGDPVDISALMNGHVNSLPTIVDPGKAGERERTLALSVVNRLLLPTADFARLEVQEQIAVAASRTPELLASHGLDEAACVALAEGRRTDALNLREPRLREHVRAFVRTNARWDESDRPTLDYLMGDEVGEPASA